MTHAPQRGTKLPDLTAAESRFGFRFPPAYRALWDAGHLTLAGPDALRLTDLEWLTPDGIARHQPFDPPATPYVPFATTARLDEWAWRLDWTEGGEPAVAFRPRGEPMVGYAPNFGGFLYRVLLEELSGSWLVTGPEDVPGQASVRRSVEIATPHLPTTWAARLRSLAARPWSVGPDGTVGVFPLDECDHIVATELAFRHLNAEA